MCYMRMTEGKIENLKKEVKMRVSIVSTKIYDKRDDFDFEIVNFRFSNSDVSRSTSYGVYISQ